MIDVSVIIPVYNVEKYLQQCIDSLLHQTLPHCEFIFVNDASPDGSLRILRENQARHPDQIVIIDSKENLRQGGARNLGLRAARGAYIGFVDSDDFAAPTMFQDLYEKATETGADATYIQYTSVEEKTDYADPSSWEGRGTPVLRWDPKLLCMKGELTDAQTCDLIALETGGGVYCGLYRKEVLLSSGVTFPEHIRYEDNYWDSMIKPYFHSVAFVEKIGYYYRKNLQSTMHLKNQSYQIDDRIASERKLLSDVRERGLFDRFHPAWEWIYTFRYAVNTFLLHLKTTDVVDAGKITGIMKDLRKQFPAWYRNPYFREYKGFRSRLRFYLIICFPFVGIRLLAWRRGLKVKG